ncbi:uncharacterized protein METZ01_LOCUS259104, partial [marine metagenome]
ILHPWKKLPIKLYNTNLGSNDPIFLLVNLIDLMH